MFEYGSSAPDRYGAAGSDVSFAIHAELGYAGALSEENVAGIAGSAVVEYTSGCRRARARSPPRNADEVGADAVNSITIGARRENSVATSVVRLNGRSGPASGRI